jgi:hypothetical protein
MRCRPLHWLSKTCRNAGGAREQHEFELTQLAPVGSALFRLVSANGLVGRQQARVVQRFTWIGFSRELIR